MKPPDLETGTISVVVDKLLPPVGRLIAYTVAFVAIVALIIVGVFSVDEAKEWLFFVAGIIGIGTNGLAIANRPRAKDEVK